MFSGDAPLEKVEKTLECSRCLAQLDVIHFSKTQSKLSSILRKCKKCVELVSILANSNGTSSAPGPLPLNVAKIKIAGLETRATQPIEAVVLSLSMASEADLLPMAECTRWCTMCQLTDKKQVHAVCSCVECEENLCAEHQGDHALRKVTSSHVVSLIEVPPQYPAPPVSPIRFQCR